MGTMRGLVLVIAAVLSVASSTPYQAKGVRGGYDEESIGPGAWLVTVQVNAYTSRGTATKYAYRRAAELCRGAGFVEMSQGQYGSTYVVSNSSGVYAGTKPEVVLAVQCNQQPQN